MIKSPQEIEKLESVVLPSRINRLKSVLDQRTRYITLILEDLCSPHNAGAVVRSAEGFGVQDIHIIQNRNLFRINKSTVSKGALKWVTQYNWNKPHVNNTEACLKNIKQQGYEIAVTVLDDDSISIDQISLDKPIALLVGSEELGASSTAKEMADIKIKIPMHGFTQSFNLSVCTGICLQALTQKLRQSEYAWQLPEAEKEALYMEWVKKCIRSF